MEKEDLIQALSNFIFFTISGLNVNPEKCSLSFLAINIYMANKRQFRN